MDIPLSISQHPVYKICFIHSPLIKGTAFFRDFFAPPHFLITPFFLVTAYCRNPFQTGTLAHFVHLPLFKFSSGMGYPTTIIPFYLDTAWIYFLSRFAASSFIKTPFLSHSPVFQPFFQNLMPLPSLPNSNHMHFP